VTVSEKIGYLLRERRAEEMHILNGTVASTLKEWRPVSALIGKIESLIMIREKIFGLIVPHKNQNCFLVIFEALTPVTAIEQVRVKPLRSIAILMGMLSSGSLCVSPSSC
jgi:hypothetical protein